MIDASVLAHHLNIARNAPDPFSATQDVLNQYKIEMQRYDPNNPGDPVDTMMRMQSAPQVPTHSQNVPEDHNLRMDWLS